ncbi:DUF3800 domain-containing protein [Sphingomonas yabuuchiae]|uniref:DUF3800 domain-containing protein n=1 Tax=Sphingomonas yabuuchiae TaxID=172044 RepID=UPI003D98E1EB
MAELTFYMDETGSRQPDKKPDASRLGRDWFAFGGFIIRREDEEAAKWARDEVARRLDVRHPFHITDMLAEAKKFSFLQRKTEKERLAFWAEYQEFLADLPVMGLGCVIDRPGYAARGYVEKHPETKWLLCRSAFDIVVERAVKYAIREDRRLRIVFESDAPFDPIVKSYFANLKQNGLEFDAANSGKYNPLTKDDFAKTLTTIESRPKSNRLLQVADSYIYAIARGKYHKQFSMWRQLCDAQRIANFALGGDAAAIKAMGIKYYCFTN